jgi:hypothetical protein
MQEQDCSEPEAETYCKENQGSSEEACMVKEMEEREE